MNKEELDILIRQLLNGELSVEAQARLKDFVQDESNRQQFVEIMETLTSEEKEEIPFREEVWLPVISKIVNPEVAPVKKVLFLQRSWVRYAAAILLVAGAATYFLLQRKTNNTELVQQPSRQNTVLPGQDGAILTLADGSTVVLDSAGNGEIATQNGAKIVQQNGHLVYRSEKRQEATVHFNTMSTPKGRQFQLQLPDGTNVWLNAASSIRYPTAFNGKERKVEITGEVYFEVAKNKQLPFRVSANHKSEIEVLGTSFNVNAYENETSLNTTLLDGAIQVLAGKQKLVLKPGQQAQLGRDLKVISNIDTDQVMAWKNGMFNFENISLQQAMREIERWYNIEVEYEGKVPEIYFSGKLPKNISLASLLTALDAANVHFRMDNNKLIVSK